MRIIKLLALAAVVGGIIWAILKIGALIDNASGQQGEGVSYKDALEEFNKEYKGDWDERKEWDYSLYERHRDMAAQMATGDKIDEQTLEKVNVNINKYVLARLVTLLETDYKKSEMPVDKVRKNLVGIDTLAKYMQNDRDIAKMKGAWQTYNDIKSFVDKVYSPESFTINLHGSSWTSFDDHKSAICNKRDAYKQDTYYKEYFKNNTTLTSGLASVEDKVEKCRSDYNRRVLNQVKSIYGSVPSFDNKEYYFSRMRSAKSESQWRQAMQDFDNAWSRYREDVRAKRRTLGEINNRFKNQVNDGEMVKQMSSVYANFNIPSKPSVPNKPNFK